VGQIETTSESVGLLCPPEKLTDMHGIKDFFSGVEVLDAWLKDRALKNQKSGAAVTYVVCVNKRVVGFYSLSTATVRHENATGRVKRNMPDPIPAMLIGRLAVDKEWQKMGLGRGLVRDATLRILKASEIAGIRVIVVHTISDQAKAFYENLGFHESPMEPATLMITLQDASNNLEP